MELTAPLFSFLIEATSGIERENRFVDQFNPMENGKEQRPATRTVDAIDTIDQLCRW
jgi:hypothetical protein